jgi:hypothetical protein
MEKAYRELMEEHRLLKIQLVRSAAFSFLRAGFKADVLLARLFLAFCHRMRSPPNGRQLRSS